MPLKSIVALSVLLAVFTTSGITSASGEIVEKTNGNLIVKVRNASLKDVAYLKFFTSDRL